jgi:hypothetical protein
MHFAVALRADGALDFYCNFTCVSTFDPAGTGLDPAGNAGLPARVTRVEMDFQRIYFQTESEVPRVECAAADAARAAGGAPGEHAQSRKKIELWTCDLSNNRLIGKDTCRRKTKP